MIAQFHKETFRRSPLAFVLIALLVCTGLTDGLTIVPTWDDVARRDWRTTHQERHANIVRVRMRHEVTGKALAVKDGTVVCETAPPGAEGLWEARFDEDFGVREQIVYVYSVAARRYLTWDKQGNVAANGLDPNETTRWGVWNMGGRGARIVPQPFADFYLRAVEQGRVWTAYGSDPCNFWYIDQLWRIKTSDDPKSNPQWRREHVPGPD